MGKYMRFLSSALFWVATFLFWWLAYPQALSFMEQNQLFLFTWDNLVGSLSQAGGLADYISDFLIQFSVVPALGSAVVASLLTLMQILAAAAAGKGRSIVSYILSFIPSLLTILCLGDYFTQLCLPVAVCMSLAACALHTGYGCNAAALAGIPVLFWLAGPAAWIFVLFVALRPARPAAAIASVCIAAVTVLLIKAFLMPQYPFVQVVLGTNYYAIKLRHPALHHILIASAAIIPTVVSYIPKFKADIAAAAAVFVLALGATWLLIPGTYDKTSYEIIAYDQLVRQQKWNEVVSRAEKYQPKADIACVSVNLSLMMTDQMDRLPEFYQCGTKGLLMPRVRDFISNTSTGEAFFRMGFVNEALRYAFDTQESIPTLKKSGRWLKRMAECQILNGRYEVASKYIDILKHTLFYRRWAMDEEEYLYNMDRIMANREYAYILSIRPQDDYLYYYPHMENQLAKQYFDNRDNLLAGCYLMAWHNLKEMENADE